MLGDRVGWAQIFSPDLSLSAHHWFLGQNIGLGCPDLEGGVELAGLRSEELFPGVDFKTSSEGGRLQ